MMMVAVTVMIDDISDDHVSDKFEIFDKREKSLQVFYSHQIITHYVS